MLRRLTVPWFLVATILFPSCGGKKSDTTCDSNGQCITTLAAYGGAGCECYSNSLTADATSIYWRSCSGLIGSVNKVSIDGGDTTALYQGMNGPCSVAVDGTSAYWINDSDAEIMKVPLEGGDATSLVPQQQPYLYSVAVDSTSVYSIWSNGSATSLVKVPLGGGVQTTLASGDALNGFTGGGQVAADGTNVYWTDPFSGCAGNVMAMPIDGGTPTQLATGIGSGAGLAIDATTVYVTTGGGDPTCPSEGGSLMAIPIAGGAPVVLASGLPGPLSLAVDDENVYWVMGVLESGSYGGSVMKMPIGGGTPITLASADGDGLAVDATSVYFWSGGYIKKLTPK